MRTTGTAIRVVRRTAYDVLRHLPRTRLAVRRAYWSFQQVRYNRLASRIRVDEGLVLFEAYGGRSYGCSPKAIYCEMTGNPRYNEYKFVWCFKDGCVPEGEPELARASIVIRGTQEYFETVAAAGTIIVNNRLPEYVTPGKNQTYVQCWHGTPLKRLGYDVEHMSAALNTADELADRFGMDSVKWNHLLSPSTFTSEHLCDAFGVPEKRRKEIVLELGYPRNDELARVAGDDDAKRKMAAELGVPEGKKALLYAPTWRDDSYQSGVGYVFDYLLDLKAMKQALGDEWVVLFRPHYYISNEFDFDAYGGFVIDASAGDINRLYIAADALVTDYSSVMFDYAVLRRPMLLYVPDLEHYAGDIRGFYFDIHEVPGPLCGETSQLIEAVQDLDAYWREYGKRYDAHIARFCPHDDGHAAERVVDALFGRRGVAREGAGQGAL